MKDGVQKTESQENDGPGHDEKKEKKVKGNKYKASKNEQKLNEIVAEVNDPALPPPKPFNPALIGPPISHNFRNSMLVEPIRKWFETEVSCYDIFVNVL